MHNTEGVKPYYWKKWVKVDNLALNGAKGILIENPKSGDGYFW